MKYKVVHKIQTLKNVKCNKFVILKWSNEVLKNKYMMIIDKEYNYSNNLPPKKVPFQNQ